MAGGRWPVRFLNILRQRTDDRPPTTIQRLLRAIPALAWMALIYIVSDIPARRLPSVASKDWALHFFEYLILGVLLMLAATAFPSTRTVSYLLSALIGTAYAGLDEWHQSFVPGRDPSRTDFLFDFLGIAVALLAVLIAERKTR